jgi:hypothetical protein
MMGPQVQPLNDSEILKDRIRAVKRLHRYWAATYHGSRVGLSY